MLVIHLKKYFGLTVQREERKVQGMFGLEEWLSVGSIQCRRWNERSADGQKSKHRKGRISPTSEIAGGKAVKWRQLSPNVHTQEAAGVIEETTESSGCLSV